MAGLGIDTIHELSAADLDQLAALGYSTVVRYGSSPGGMNKDIHQAEFTRIVNHPVISLCANWEDSGAEYEGGFARGVQDGTRARQFFRALGWPDTRPIYFSSEGTATRPMTAAKAPLLYDYHRGINSVSPRGIEAMYGPGWACAELISRSLVSHVWQWGGSGPTVAGAQVRQRTAKDARLPYSHDLNDLLALDHGQWNAASTGDGDLTPAQDTILNTILQEVEALKKKVDSIPASVWDGYALSGTPYAASVFLHDARVDAGAAAANTASLPTGGIDPEALAKVVNDQVTSVFESARYTVDH